MAWLYHRSATWRKVVSFTARGPLYMAGFAAAAVGIPLFIGDQIMGSTNGPKAESKLEQQLRNRSSVDSNMLAKAQKERLQVLFDEIRDGGGAARYKAALDGQSLGTHSRGTTVGAVAISKE